jgi:hypothetical protein
VDGRAFGRFLGMLGQNLPEMSRVVYDFKIRGVQDDLGRGERTLEPFRLSAVRPEISAFHAARGMRLDRVEWSADLCRRMLGGQAWPDSCPFEEDGLAEFVIGGEKASPGNERSNAGCG